MTENELILLLQAILFLVVVGLLIVRRVTAKLPFFTAYLIFSVISAATGFALSSCLPSAYFYYVIAAYILDAALYLLVIAELAGSILDFNRQDRLRRLIALPIFAVASLLLWPLAQWTAPSSMGSHWPLLSNEMHATFMLEVAAVVALIAWSMLLKLRWPESQLRILTGMGLWPIVGVTVLVIHSIGPFGKDFDWLDLLAPGSSIVAALYWIHYFWIVQPAIRRAATA